MRSAARCSALLALATLSIGCRARRSAVDESARAGTAPSRLRALAATGRPAAPVLEYAVTTRHGTSIYELQLGDEPRRVSPEAEGRGWFPATGPVRLAIAVLSEKGDHSEQLAVMDRGVPRPVGLSAGKVRKPSVAPDGSFAVVESNAESFRDLYRVDLATGASKRLTRDGDGAFEPAVSPDGRRVLFVSTASGNPELCVISIDGTERRQLTRTAAHESAPAWSPGGDRIAFVSDRDGPERLFVMGADGTMPRRLTRRAGSDRHEVGPVWSPSGKQLAYMVHAADGTSELWVTELATGHTRRVSTPRGHVGDPAWSPDGTMLAYSDGNGGPFDLYVVRTDGSDRRRLTRSPADEWLPRWRPR